MQAGVARRTLHIAAAILFVSVACVEIFGNSLHLLTYYGKAPMKYLGFAPQAVTYPIVGGFLLYALANPLARWAARPDRLHDLGDDPADRVRRDVVARVLRALRRRPLNPGLAGLGGTAGDVRRDGRRGHLSGRTLASIRQR